MDAHIKRLDNNKIIKRYAQHKYLIGRGTHTWCFNYKDDRVLKICSTDSIKLDIKEAHLFKDFIPPMKIIHRDSQITCYIQHKCEPLIGSDMYCHGMYVLSCLLLVLHMLKVNRMSSDIGKNNWGTINGKYYIYDWHPFQKHSNFISMANFLSILLKRTVKSTEVTKTGIKHIYESFYKGISPTLTDEQLHNIKRLYNKIK